MADLAREWLDGLDLDAAYKRDILTPWLASLTCGNTELARTQSARAHLSSFARTFRPIFWSRCTPTIPRSALRVICGYCSTTAATPPC
ncbi:hypothetical protein NKH77_49335 [Streptomyces sp. M19]